ncbi:hypothetical protein [Mesorhizobium sp. Z1-4]|uniref:hypothetical protein n=1 Tax=Mesorhizobium sp. Z1-4 TaxID=2448478 RepID=UPI000FDBD83A|nr:hypothetical protein [Mesorhizobium sp. Z1-4]
MPGFYKLIAGSAAAIFIGIAAAGPLHAAEGAEILAAYQGDWRGSGEARPNLRSDLTKITCRISASYNPQEAALSNTGKCGTTKGAQKLEGKLSLVGDQLTGNFLGAAANYGLVNATLRIAENMIVTEAQVEDAGKMVKVRTFVTPPQDNVFLVQSQFFDRASNSWVVSGEIEFRRQ